ncbi:hypothetical protein DFA_00936 [Cavenderia fasciculata]|uniref:Cytochrome P450 family protein n=1 Tax=Cavenderia fasciculata TaxID=261658 RepID=F4PUP4_CACFS|nr:uncharacterized protein DFA_00936 [Cavenderia fasciculata]EGG21063.1 hypothetical protein DFA_00936 [Cavenderia fasciculata]|eukprot:XP_004358913.1 hypothetical protein DFA_00936 [Cavenderia fasciculata]
MFSLISTILFYSFLVYCVLSFIKKNKKRTKNDPPMPSFNLPFLGSTYRFESSVVQSLLKFTKQYGKVNALWVGDLYTLNVADAVYIKEIWTKHIDNFIDRPNTKILAALSDDHTGLIGSGGKEWNRNKELIGGYFSSLKLKSQLPRISELCMQTIDKLTKQPNTPINPRGVFREYSMDVNTGLILSLEPSQMNKQYREMEGRFDRFLHGNSPASLFYCIDILSILFSYKFTDARKQRQYLIDYVKSIYDDHVSTLDPEKPRDLMDKMIMEEGDEMSIINTVIDFYLGGVDTTALVLQLFFLSVTNNEGVQDKVYEELKSLASKRQSELGLDSTTEPYQFTFADRLETPYLNAVIKESLRIYPPTPNSILRECNQDIMVGDYFIRKGAMVIQNIWAVHHDEDYYPEPNKFIPERFLEDNHASHYFPFGIGGRSCPGSNVADITLFLLCANLLSRFKIKSEDGGSNIKCDIKDGIMLHLSPFKVLFDQR